jgi:predicted HTH domain antitoxin
MITGNILFEQKATTQNEVAKRGMDIYFNQLEKTDESIYTGIFPTYNDWRASMVYYGSKLSASMKSELLKTDLEIVRGNERRVNFGGKNTTTDFAFILNNYMSKKPVLIGVVSKSSGGFLYRTSKFNNATKDYVDAINKQLTDNSREELIQKVAIELKQEIQSF